MAEERERAGPGAVPFAGSALAHAGEEIEILAQKGDAFSYDARRTGPVQAAFILSILSIMSPRR
jgi:hypothetical protein